MDDSGSKPKPDSGSGGGAGSSGSDGGGAGGSGGTVGGTGGTAGASGGSGAPTGGSAGIASGGVGGGTGGATGGGGSGGGSGGGVTGTCPAGQFAVGVNNGSLVCTPLAPIVRDWVNQNCSIYFGWRDSCDACQSDPAKWGKTSDAACQNGVGVDNTCTTPVLGGETVRLFGLNPDGDIDNNDKLYIGFHCEPAAAGAAGQCPSGQFVTGVDATGAAVCSGIESAAKETVNQECSLYAGSSDNCDGCTTPPAKWGRVNDVACQNGVGANDTCTAPTLGADIIRLFGLNTDGDMNDDDKLYVGLHCAGAGTPTTSQCPSGQLLTGFGTTAQCAPIGNPLQTYVSSQCWVYYGWTDNCDGCTTPPFKWGRVNDTACLNGVGVDDTCTTHSLGGTIVRMFGLNTDGDVGDDDKFFYGFKCF